MRRILIINARNTADIIRAGRLVNQYEVDGKLTGPSGRYNFAYYTAKYNSTDGRGIEQLDDDGVAVWHNPNQITVRFKDQ